MEIFTELHERLLAGESVATGVVVEARGSTPQKVGSRAMLLADQTLRGTLGGGLVEAWGIEAMRRAASGNIPELLDIRLDEAYSREAGPICGGQMRVFVAAHSEPVEAVSQAIEAYAARRPGVLITRISGAPTGEVVWCEVGDALPDGIDAATVEHVLRDGDARTVVSETATFFVEPVVAPPRLLVVGGGHVGQAVARQARELGFDITVVDDRPEFARPELFPEGTTCAHGPLRKLVEAFPKDADTYIVLVSKGHRPDAEALEGCIHSNPAFLGMIGSRRKVVSLRDHFLLEGLCTEEEWSRVVTPIGYDIGAVTVPEIAVSIAAQLVAARRKPLSVRSPGVKALEG
jgi:xanthine dehydrogenase accessory factor